MTSSGTKMKKHPQSKRPEQDPARKEKSHMKDRKKDGIEGSGYQIHHPVVATVDDEELYGIVESVHQGGKKIDVRISHPGSKHHGRVVTVDPDEVKAGEAPAEKERAASE
jgi:hypothetical protein